MVSSISPSAQIVLNLSLAEFETRGKVIGLDTCRQFLFVFRRYKELEGNKTLASFFKLPLNTTDSCISNFMVHA